MMSPGVGIDPGLAGRRPYGPGALCLRDHPKAPADRVLGRDQAEKRSDEAERDPPHQAFHGTRLFMIDVRDRCGIRSSGFKQIPTPPGVAVFLLTALLLSLPRRRRPHL